MARRDELQLFSTSFIDLMACSLAGACILWILALDAVPARDEPPPRRSVWVNVTQAGVSHFRSTAIQVEVDGNTYSLDDFEAQTPRVTARGTSIHLKFESPRERDEATYGGRLDLIVEDIRDEVSVALNFGVCSESRELHPIEVRVLDRDGASGHLLFWTWEANLRAAAACSSSGCSPSYTTKPYLLPDLADAIDQADPRPRLAVLDSSATSIWRLQISRDGRVQVATPAAHPVLTGWLAGELSALPGTSTPASP